MNRFPRYEKVCPCCREDTKREALSDLESAVGGPRVSLPRPRPPAVAGSGLVHFLRGKTS